MDELQRKEEEDEAQKLRARLLQWLLVNPKLLKAFRPQEFAALKGNLESESLRFTAKRMRISKTQVARLLAAARVKLKNLVDFGDRFVRF